MSTLSEGLERLNQVKMPTEKGGSSLARIGRGSGSLFLRLLVGLAVVLLLLPVALLPLMTSVPFPLFLLLALADASLIFILLRRAESLKAKSAVFVGIFATTVLAVAFSQWLATTPAIAGADGRPLPGSIAVMEKVELNNSEQWITVRGHDVNKPVLLFLAGGPGGSELAWTRSYWADLEEHFVIVNWDQPGAGKSYGAVEAAGLTPERYVEDAYELTQLLRARFHQEKIFVIGESWGTILGLKLIQQHPELFHAYVGSGQMVNTTENDLLGYQLAIQHAFQRGDIDTFVALLKNGPPPYAEGNIFIKYSRYLMVLNGYMSERATGDGTAFNQLADVLKAGEYGLLDKVRWFLGLNNTFNAVYPQLADLDFTTQASTLEVPVYFTIGRHDVNAMASLVEDYYEVLQAPHKELIWFEKSGHTPMWEERGKFMDVMVNTVLAQTLPQPPAAAANLADPLQVEAFFDELMPKQLRTYHIAGAAVSLVKDGQLLFSEGYGFADLEARAPVVADQTLFRTDSTGKLFVWTAVMQLVEQGKVDLDANVNTYLDFPIPATFAEPITLRHLLSHSAGFEDQGYMFAHHESELDSPGAFLAKNMPARVRPPGQLSAYSNYGTALAGYIVERVSNMPFEQYAEAFIFGPLDMQLSTFRQPLPATLEATATQNYRYSDGRFRPQPFQFLQVPSAGEGHMTVTDMAQFMMAHLQQGDTPILGQETIQQMHSRLFANEPRVNGFAYGFAETIQNNQRILRHEGNNPGMSSTALFLIPDQNVGLYVAYNSNGGFGPGEALRSAFLDRYFPVPAAQPEPVQLTNRQLEALSGSYRSTRMFQSTFGKVIRLLGGNYADIVVKANADGTFTVRGVDSAPTQWVAVAPGVLRAADGTPNSHGDLIFGADEEGRISELFVSNNPYRAYEKVSWYEGIAFHILLLALCLMVFLTVLIAAPLVWLIRRKWFASSLRVGRQAGWLLIAACAFNLLFLLGLLITFEESLLYGVTPGLIVVMLLPLTSLALVVASLIMAVRDRLTAGWGLMGRLHYGVAIMATAIFACWLAYWNLLGFQF